MNYKVYVLDEQSRIKKPAIRRGLDGKNTFWVLKCPVNIMPLSERRLVAGKLYGELPAANHFRRYGTKPKDIFSVIGNDLFSL